MILTGHAVICCLFPNCLFFFLTTSVDKLSQTPSHKSPISFSIFWGSWGLRVFKLLRFPACEGQLYVWPWSDYGSQSFNQTWIYGLLWRYFADVLNIHSQLTLWLCVDRMSGSDPIRCKALRGKLRYPPRKKEMCLKMAASAPAQRHPVCGSVRRSWTWQLPQPHKLISWKYIYISYIYMYMLLLFNC